MKILVLGSTGLIGRTVFRVLLGDPYLDVFATCRGKYHDEKLDDKAYQNIIHDIDVNCDNTVNNLLSSVNPDVVINCIGLTKHKYSNYRKTDFIILNSLFPHKLSALCKIYGSRLIHISTDCVFSGEKGFYNELDRTDAIDIYGKSKAIGEMLSDDDLVIRTSTIGHELNSNYGLLNWFLSQEKCCKGFKNAVFSGLPTIVFAKILKDYVLTNKSLKGLYHVAADSINKYELLKLIAKTYNKDIEVLEDDSFIIDRSLDSTKFEKASGFKSPCWNELIKIMWEYK